MRLKQSSAQQKSLTQRPEKDVSRGHRAKILKNFTTNLLGSFWNNLEEWLPNCCGL
jgi:hypothetical protein